MLEHHSIVKITKKRGDMMYLRTSYKDLWKKKKLYYNWNPRI